MLDGFLDRRRDRWGVGSLVRQSLPAALLALGACSNIFEDDYLTDRIPPERLREIEAQNLEDQSLTEPVSVDEVTNEYRDRIFDLEQPPPPESVDLSLGDTRVATLANNLDLDVQLVAPSIAKADLDAEEAKFEWTFRGSAKRTVTDQPTIDATQTSQGQFDQYELGLIIPTRTGGTVTVDLPFSETQTNAAFSANEFNEADVRFTLSQPLLRNAGVEVNTHSIRVASFSRQISEAQTKLEAIRILASADRAYWLLFAAQRELEVRYQQYELARQQLEQARRKVTAGDLPEIEVIRAESGVAQRLEAIIISRTVVLQRRRDLKRIMNRDDVPIESPTAFVLTTEAAPTRIDLDPVVLADRAVANRMEMLELELQLAIDASTVDLRRNEKLPSLVLDYTYNVNGVGFTYGDAFDQVGDKNFEDWSVGVRAEIPIGNEAAEARLHRAILQRLQRLSTKRLRTLAIRQEVFDSVDQLTQNWQRIVAARLAVDLAQRTFEAEQRQFDVGLRTSTDVLDAAAALADSQSQEIRALADYQMTQVDIAFATGTILGLDRVRWEPIETDER